MNDKQRRQSLWSRDIFPQWVPLFGGATAGGLLAIVFSWGWVIDVLIPLMVRIRLEA